MRNTELERIATILATSPKGTDVANEIWQYLVGCGVDPDGFRDEVEETPVDKAGARFEVDQVLSVRSLGDWDCVFRFTVTKRSAKFVTLDWHGQERRIAIRKWSDDVEYCYPLGTYSLAPLCRADAEEIL
jgi:hypothetical protein